MNRSLRRLSARPFVMRRCSSSGCWFAVALSIALAGCSATPESLGSVAIPQAAHARSAPKAAAEIAPAGTKATAAPTPPAVAAAAADSIVATIGVVTHFSYYNTVYRYLTPSDPAPNGDSVLSSLKTLGVRHLRDGIQNIAADSAICPAFKSAYANGTDVDVVMLPTDTASTFASAYSCMGSALRGYEGPNELDTSDPTYAADDVTAMSRLAAARGSAFPASVVLFAPSMAGGCTSYEAEAAVSNDKIAGFFDANNAHIYFGGYQPENTGTGGDQCGIGPYGDEYTYVTASKIPAVSKPFVITETGYPDDCCSYSDSGYVSPTVKTKYILRSLLLHYYAGAPVIYFYELATEGQSYGLTDQYLNPKPAYTALENFIRIMQDPGGARTGALNYALSANLQSDALRLLFEKQDGSFWFVIWLPNQSWNPLKNTATTVPPITGTISLGSVPKALKLYTFNPATGAVTTSTPSASTKVTLSVSDTPEILQIGTTTTPPVLATPQPPVY